MVEQANASSLGASLSTPGRKSRAGVELPDDRFIPLHGRDLAHAIAEQPDRFPLLADDVQALANEIDHVIGQETTAFQRFIGERYEAVDPARETKAVRPKPASARLAELHRMVEYLLEKANYEHLAQTEIEATIDAAKSHGMRIRTNPDRLSRLDLYVRGQTTDERRRRSLRSPIRGKKHTVEVFRRLVVVFQFKGEDSLNLKLFRDIPVSDVEALLPHAEVAMSTLDRLKIGFGGAGAFGGLAWKALTGSVFVGQFIWAWVAAFLGLSVRAFLGYRRSQVARASQMTHNLYYRIVANNAGVLELLLGNLGQEEAKEALLAYAILLHAPTITSHHDLGLAASQWLEQTFDVVVDFDAIDAVSTLDRLGLWEDRQAMVPLPAHLAIAHLVEHGRDGQTKHHHRQQWRQLVQAPTAE